MCKWRGNEVWLKNDGLFCYEDGTLVADDPTRACGHCGLKNTDAGHDGCLGTIPGVVNACCGHGEISGAYVVLSNGARLAGLEALDFFDENQQPKPAGSLAP